MTAVANNPEFAKKVGVPKSVGEEFMKKSKGYMGGGMMKRYAEGDMVDANEPMSGSRRGRREEMTFEERIRAGEPSQESMGMQSKENAADVKAGMVERGANVRPKRKPKPPMMGMKHGGKVRGCGMARGMRPCKMVKMKGA